MAQGIKTDEGKMCTGTPPLGAKKHLFSMGATQGLGFVIAGFSLEIMFGQNDIGVGITTVSCILWTKTTLIDRE